MDPIYDIDKTDDKVHLYLNVEQALNASVPTKKLRPTGPKS